MNNNGRVIVDAGVIVGLVRPRDQWHDWAIEVARELTPPFYTCDAAVSEALFLVRDLWPARQRILGLLSDGFLKLDFSLSAELEQTISLITKYADVPMALADACLVRMSELDENASVFTVDSDFLIYRKNGRKKIPLISPF